MMIVPIPTLKDNYVWTITINNQTLIVDPGEAAPVNSFLRQHQLSLTGILITHHHWDHTNGIQELTNNLNIPVFGPANEKIAGLTIALHDHDTVQINQFPLAFRVIAIPGHTLGHIAYYSPGILFCGDTLFSAGCGRLFEGTAEQMYISLQKIAALPDETKIYCAHEYTLNNLRFAALVEPGNKLITARIEYVTALREKNMPSLPSTLKDEKETNPFLRCDSPELIANVERYAGLLLGDPISVFSWVRKWKDAF